jgi:hypothetical protein
MHIDKPAVLGRVLDHYIVRQAKPPSADIEDLSEPSVSDAAETKLSGDQEFRF